MDSKDFLKLIKFRDKEAKKQAQVTYAMKQRGSRPRIKKNIIQPDHEAIDHMYGYFGEDK